MMDVGKIFLDILTVVSDAITSLLGILPNPDPFPEILDNMTITANDSISVCYYWLDQFFIADAVVTSLGVWFVMFPLAWIILMLWKWVNAR